MQFGRAPLILLAALIPSRNLVHNLTIVQDQLFVSFYRGGFSPQAAGVQRTEGMKAPATTSRRDDLRRISSAAVLFV